MGLGPNRAGTQWGTVGLVHIGTGVQWGWGTMGLVHIGMEIQPLCDSPNTMVQLHIGAGAQWYWYTTGQWHSLVGTVGLYTVGWGQWDCTQWGGDTVGMLHNGVQTQWDSYTVGWGTVGLYTMRWGHSGTVTQWGRGTVDCPRAAVPQIFAIRIFCGICVACL